MASRGIIMERKNKDGNHTAIIKEDNFSKSLLQAAKNGNFRKIKALIEQGGCLDCQDENGNTPLILASTTGQEEIVSALLKNGADPWIRNKEEQNAMDVAKDNFHYTLMKSLHSAMNTKIWFHPDELQPAAGNAYMTP